MDQGGVLLLACIFQKYGSSHVAVRFHLLREMCGEMPAGRRPRSGVTDRLTSCVDVFCSRLADACTVSRGLQTFSSIFYLSLTEPLGARRGTRWPLGWTPRGVQRPPHYYHLGNVPRKAECLRVPQTPTSKPSPLGHPHLGGAPREGPEVKRGQKAGTLIP